MKKKWYLLANMILLSQVIGTSQMLVTKADFTMETEEMVTPAAAVANYVLKNLDEINTYRQEHGFHDDVTSAAVSDITVTVYTRAEEIQAKLLDFDGSKGYIIVGDNYECFGFAFKGKIPFNAFTDGVHCYSDQEGFSYIDFRGQKVILGHLEGSNPSASSDVAYNGQYLPGEGRIYNTDAYVADRYVSLDYEREGSITTQNGYPATGFAIADYNSYLDPEGNIPNIKAYVNAMSTTFMIGKCDFMQSIMGEYTALQEQSYLPGINEPEIFEKKSAEGYTQIMRKYRLFPRKFRALCNEMYGGVENLTNEQAVDLTLAYCEAKGHTYKTSSTRFVASHISEDTNYFDINNRPALLCIPESITYNGLAVLYACGYKSYSKTEKITSILKKKTWYHFVEVMDGTAENERTYVDLYCMSNEHYITLFTK